MSGTPSRQSRGVDPPVQIRRVEGAQRKWCGKTSVFLLRETGMVALILLYMVRGARWVELRLRVLPVRWIGAGLLLAVATGFGSMWFGRPFLTSHFQVAEVPLLGPLPLASAVLFDLGVFSVVVGATTLILIALAHQSLRRPRQLAAAEIEGKS